MSLQQALTEKPEFIKSHLQACLDIEPHAFTAMNTAFIEDGMVIHIPTSQQFEPLIECVFLSSAEQPAHYNPIRNLIVMGENAPGNHR